ncbi:hypothetical protein [Thiohalocapsa marina]|uniref:hypothetical protein n=1 Tax=Thiohalocapsa marina TaxID=424902 RepID=UPI0036D77834
MNAPGKENDEMVTIRYAGWPSWLARLALLAIALLIGYGLLLDVEPLHEPEVQVSSGSAGDRGDIALYRRVVERMQGGEDFYTATGDEQHQRNYPTKPFLAWRLPTLAWVISNLGEVWAANLLRFVALVAVLAWIMELKDLGLRRREVIGGALLAYSSLVIALPPPTYYLHECWAATFMALSLAVRQRCWPLGVFFGLVALAFRELALPFVLAMAVCALWEGRHREAAWWGAGIIAFALGLAAHAWVVSGHVPPDGLQGASWLAFGGWHFVLSASQWNVLIVAAGPWLAAFWLPLALLGAAARRDPLGTRLMLLVAGYSAAFLFVGRDNNGYWGIIYAPLVAISVTFAPAGLRVLWASARGRPVTAF